MRQSPPRWAIQLFFILFGLAAVLSALQGFHHALQESQDFQWSGTFMLDQHIDPWRDYLLGDPIHAIRLEQIPNYLPILYLLISPLGLISFSAAKLIWALLNITFVVTASLVAARWYGLRGLEVATVVCFMFCATPVRTTLGNGQQPALVLVVWTLALLAPRITRLRSTAAGISYFKYNFAPPLFLYLLLREGFVTALCSGIPAVVSGFVAWLWLGGTHSSLSFPAFLVQPLQVAQSGYMEAGGSPNLMDVLDTVLRALGTAEKTRNQVTLLVACAVCIALLYYAVRVLKHRLGLQMAVLGLISFCLFRHHNYDAVTLLFPLCYALVHRHSRYAQVILGVSIYLLLARRALDAVAGFVPWMYLVDALLFFTLIPLLFLTDRQARQAEAATPAPEFLTV